LEINKCALVIKETALSQSRRAARLATSGDATARRLIHAHDEHHRTADYVRKALAKRSIAFKETTLRKVGEARRRIAAADFVITVGGDGTALGSSHYVRDAAMLAVNSAPRDSVGHFCSVSRKDFSEKLDQILGSRVAPVKLARIAVSLDDRQLPELALNDVLIAHNCPAATTRYIIEAHGVAEEHRSSGLWVATAAGSTAAIRSAGGRVAPLRSRRMQYFIRELYREPGRDYRLVRGFIEPGEDMVIASKMPEGWLYIDGARTVYPFPFGTRARLRLAEHSLRIFLRDSKR
jgi:NAD+ kinase